MCSCCALNASSEEALLHLSRIILKGEHLALRSRTHDLDLLTVGSDIVESQLGTLITNRLNTTGKCDLQISLVGKVGYGMPHISLVLDDISICELALRTVLLDEVGDTVRDMEFVRVWVRVLGVS